MIVLCVAGLAAEVAGAIDAPGAIAYGPPPAWIKQSPAPGTRPAPADAPVRIGFLDNQIRIDPDGTEEAYTAYRLTILKPEGLPAGNISVGWQPDDGPATVHYVRLIREGRTTDVLATTKFTVLQREAQLEQATLTGQRTATLQVPGLQVGDELAVAVTVRRRDAALGGGANGLVQMPVMGTPGTFGVSLRWPRSRPMIARFSKDMPAVQPSSTATETMVSATFPDPDGAVPTEGAPPRFNVRRLFEFSDFGSWQDVSRRIAPLFERAAVLDAASPVRTEAAAIAARTADPAERAQAALQLVEDRIRYVYVGLNGGNYVPATADQTWSRRFGDCKGKTVLLVALLRQLGIAAEPALVNSMGGDGLDERLPGPRVFDHVIVRAKIGPRQVWLDGTRLGDRFLDNLPMPFRWALPLTPAGADLQPIAPRDTGFPVTIGIANIDASAGTDHDAHITLTNIVRGDEAFAIRTQLSALSATDADRALKSYWRTQADWVTADTVSWRYDERRGAVTLAMSGEGNPGWKGDAGQGHTLTITGAGFYPPDPLRRPRDQDQAASWAVAFPRFKCWATTVRLPKAGEHLGWTLSADPMNRQLGGFIYWRASGLQGNVVRTVMSTRSYEPEASAQEAAIVNRAIPGFNNNMSSISEEKGRGGAQGKLPFGDDVDWLNAPAPCSVPAS